MIGPLRAHRRAAFYAALALAAPLPAFALGGEGGEGEIAPEAPAALSVSATLDGCGLAEERIVCTLDVSYGGVEGATSYTASVSAPDGSVTDYGAVAPGGTTLTVPYAGNGAYSVRITAYGDPPGPGDEVVLDDAEAAAVETKPPAAKAEVEVGGAGGDRNPGGGSANENTVDGDEAGPSPEAAVTTESPDEDPAAAPDPCDAAVEPEPDSVTDAAAGCPRP